MENGRSDYNDIHNVLAISCIPSDGRLWDLILEFRGCLLSLVGRYGVILAWMVALQRGFRAENIRMRVVMMERYTPDDGMIVI